MKNRFISPLITAFFILTGSFVCLLSGVVPAAPDESRAWTPVPARGVRISPVVQRFLSARNDPVKVWVFFTDKGIFSESAYQTALQTQERRLTERSAQRRRLRKTDDMVDFYDIPVHSSYLEQIRALGGQTVGVSRWLNAASVLATPEIIRRIAELPSVLSITPVSIHRREIPERGTPDIPTRPYITPGSNALNYGPSFTQLAQMRVPQLHDLGLSGHGVLIAMFDTGFNLNHQAFDSLRTRILANWDFINGDDNVADDPQQDIFVGQHDHGTETLSAIAGYAPGALIGPAYGAHFLLAKTESIAFERQVEEDWWVQAVEWADSLGADIISSSLGYNSWYQYSDMDGQTAVTTRAASLAVSRGIVVVNAMGNEGQSTWQKLIAPADAAGVISVGAVDSTGSRAGFSSKGPTFDRRLKPDVVAMGVAVRVADPGSSDRYIRLNGTSFSTPLTAGAAALLLEAYPHWTPAQVLSALRSTASRSASPDTLTGYGVVNTLNALLTEAQTRVIAFSVTNDVNGVLLQWQTSLEVNIQGWRLSRRAGSTGAFSPITSDPVAGQGAGAFVTSRTYFYLDTTTVHDITYDYLLEPVPVNNRPIETLSRTATITFVPSGNSNLPPFSLHQNFPNPFNPATRISYDLTQAAQVSLDIFNTQGQKVRALFRGLRGPGRHEELWDGRDDRGRALASGIYFYRLVAGSFVDTKKMLLIR